MKRTKQKRNPDLILCADFHLMESQPPCRTDNFWDAQWEKVDFISNLCLVHDNCPVIHGGDLFHHWKPSPYLLTEAIKRLPGNFWTIYGNHDLPQHSLELAHKCGINTLKSAGSLKIIKGCHWGEIPKNFSLLLDDRKILVWHVMTYQNKMPWPNCTDPPAGKLLGKYPGYDLILTGHNHQSFVEEYKGRLLVNPGSLTRYRANQTDHEPRVYLWYAEDNRVIPVYLPIKQNVITREHIDHEEQQDGRIDAFVSRLDNDWKAAMGAEQSLQQFCQVNQVRKSVMEIVTRAMDIHVV